MHELAAELLYLAKPPQIDTYDGKTYAQFRIRKRLMLHDTLKICRYFDTLTTFRTIHCAIFSDIMTFSIDGLKNKLIQEFIDCPGTNCFPKDLSEMYLLAWW